MAKLTKQYNLKKINPKLAKEWHPTKNGDLTPKDVTPKSSKEVWWHCKKKHQWQTTILSRSNGSECPYCSGRRKWEREIIEQEIENLRLSRHLFESY